MMAAIRGRDTLPEMRVRRYLHATGLRFRLHSRALPGKPDLVLPQHRVAVFVHGCFWHRHHGCPYATTPSTRESFWSAKFAANVARDARNASDVLAAGWTSLVIWECETMSDEALDTLYWRILAAKAE
jgi:DNA mismatch endonuclease (patch repair protein)